LQHKRLSPKKLKNKNMFRLKKFITRQKLFIIGISILAGSLVGFTVADDYFFEVSKNLDIFTTLFRDVNMYYVDSIQPGSLMKSGIDGMLKNLDPYTVFIPESDLEDYKMTHISAEYGGIGALVQQRDGMIQISEIYEGFPAQKADVKVGDVILSVNGVSTKSKQVSDVTDFMKGQKGTTVKIIFQREGEAKPIEKTIVRDEIKFKNVPFYGMVNENTGYIKLNQFLEEASDQVKEGLLALKQNPKFKYLILDLRGNGGGLLREAVDIVNLFVDKGQKIVNQKGKIKEMNMEYLANKTAVDPQIPLVVLVDRGSASASEIVTGAMQELDRGVVIGERTFGKGLVQQTYNLSYNTLLKVTIAKYYTPSGRCIQALDYTHRNKDGSVAHVADSLMHEFKTKGGRSVYDGSGIYPDIYTERKSFSSISKALSANYLFFDYASKYVLEHPSIAPAKDFKLTDAEYNDFVGFLSGKKYDYKNQSEKEIEQLQAASEKEKYFPMLQNEFNALKKKMEDSKKQDLTNHRDEIKEILETEIASRYYYQKGRLESDFKYDTDLQKCIETLNNNALYSSILAGEGKYKVIGKPGTEVHAKADTDSDNEE
jgi:carboxyl-terminal processing protease